MSRFKRNARILELVRSKKDLSWGNLVYKIKMDRGYNIISIKSFTLEPKERIKVSTMPGLFIGSGYRSFEYQPSRKMMKKGLAIGGEINHHGETRLILRNIARRYIRIEAGDKIGRVKFKCLPKEPLESDSET